MTADHATAPRHNSLHPRYWFGRVDARPVAAFRVVFALLLLKDALYHTPLAHIFYSDSGIMPRSIVTTGFGRGWRFSLMDSIGDGGVAALFFGLWAVVALLLLLGWHARLMSILNFIIILSVHERNALVLNGGDQAMRVLSFWAIFLPLSAYYSLDAIRNRRKAYNHAGRWSALRADGAHTTFAFPLRMIQLQVALVYLFTFWLKLYSDLWLNGETIYHSLQLQSFASPIGDWLFSLQANGLYQLATIGTLVAEGFFIVGVFAPIFQPRLKILALVMGALLHIGIGVAMAIPNFSLVMMISYVLFFEPAWIQRLDRWLHRTKGRSTIPLPPDKHPLWLPLALTRDSELTVNRDIQLQSTDFDDWTVTDDSGHIYSGYSAWMRLCGHLPLSLMWVWILRPTIVRRSVWSMMGWNVRRWALKSPRFDLLPAEPDWKERFGSGCMTALSRTVLTIILGSLMVLVIGLNGLNLPENMPFSVTREQGTVLVATGLWQRWDMFAPVPLREDGWILLTGIFNDGTVWDLRADRHLPEDLEETRIRWWFGPDARWKKFDDSQRSVQDQRVLQTWAWYYCRLHNETQSNDARLVRVEIQYVGRYTHAPNEPPNPFSARVLWQQDCP